LDWAQPRQYRAAPCAMASSRSRANRHATSWAMEARVRLGCSSSQSRIELAHQVADRVRSTPKEPRNAGSCSVAEVPQAAPANQAMLPRQRRRRMRSSLRTEAREARRRSCARSNLTHLPVQGQVASPPRALLTPRTVRRSPSVGMPGQGQRGSRRASTPRTPPCDRPNRENCGVTPTSTSWDPWWCGYAARSTCCCAS
jgi:hypothetical protein